MSSPDKRVDAALPTQLRIRLKYADVESFVEKFAPNVSRQGIFIASKQPKPVGTALRFELLLSDGKTKLLKGEGAVTWIREFDPDNPARPRGMGVKFSRLDADSRKLVERIETWKREQGGSEGDAMPAATATDDRPVSMSDVEAPAPPPPEPPPPEPPRPAPEPLPPAPEPRRAMIQLQDVAPPQDSDAIDVEALLGADGVALDQALAHARIRASVLAEGGWDDLAALLEGTEPRISPSATNGESADDVMARALAEARAAARARAASAPPPPPVAPRPPRAATVRGPAPPAPLTTLPAIALPVTLPVTLPRIRPPAIALPPADEDEFGSGAATGVFARQPLPPPPKPESAVAPQPELRRAPPPVRVAVVESEPDPAFEPEPATPLVAPPEATVPLPPARVETAPLPQRPPEPPRAISVAGEMLARPISQPVAVVIPPASVQLEAIAEPVAEPVAAPPTVEIDPEDDLMSLLDSVSAEPEVRVATVQTPPVAPAPAPVAPRALIEADDRTIDHDISFDLDSLDIPLAEPLAPPPPAPTPPAARRGPPPPPPSSASTRAPTVPPPLPPPPGPVPGDDTVLDEEVPVDPAREGAPKKGFFSKLFKK